MAQSGRNGFFDTLFTRNVPHILENIFFSLDYQSFKTCMNVNEAWKALFSSDAYKRRSQELRIEKQMNETKLQDFIREGNAEEVKRLNTLLADVNTNNCLIEAVLWGHNDVVKIFIDVGADIDTPYGGTTLSIAAHLGYKEIVNTLLDAGAVIDKADYEGMTPLHKAVRYGHNGVVELLIERGALPDIPDVNGQTPLHMAVKNGKYHMIKLLTEGGADPYREDRRGITPIQEATNQGFSWNELAHIFG